MFIFAKMNNMEYEKKRAIILAVLGVIGVILVFSLRPKRERWIKETGIVWATEYHITYLSNKDLTDSINFAFRRVELSVSPFNKHSLVTAINEGKSDSLNPILIDLFYRSMNIHKATEGAFDPTISPLINAWGFGYEDGNLPNDKTIDSILSFTGLDKISINGNRIIRKDSRTSFNFSAIAKGYGCDEIARMFERNSVNNYLIEVGGEIVAKGDNVMKGYYKRPELTEKAISPDGWLDTGDLAIESIHGELKILGRVKDTIVLTGGENIEPLPLEAKMQESRFIQTAVVVGQDQRNLGALILPNQEELELWANENNISFKDFEDLVKKPEAYKLIEDEIKELINAKNGFRMFEKIVKFAFLTKPFEVGKELSAKQEIMRYKLTEIYEKEIKGIFKD